MRYPYLLVIPGQYLWPATNLGKEQFEELDRCIREKIVQLSSNQYQCLDCDYASKRKENLQSHIESRHVIQPGIVCLLCNKILPTRQAFRMHKTRSHKDHRNVT